MDDLITPMPFLAHTSGETSSLEAHTPVAEAGYIRFNEPQIQDEKEELHGRLFSVTAPTMTVTSPTVAEIVGRMFHRVVPPGKGDPTRMPAGRVVGGVFRENGDAIALSRPVDVAWKKTAVVAPQVPKGDADVFVHLSVKRLIKWATTPRASPAESPSRAQPELKGGPGASKRESASADEAPATEGLRLEDLTIRLTSTFEDPRTPDVVIAREDGIVAIWYGLSLRRATLECDLGELYLPPRELRLVPGNVTTFRGELQKKPALDVQLNAPPDAFDSEEITLRVLAPDAKVLHESPVAPGTHTRIEAMPPARLDVQINAGRWQLTRRVDLTNGKDGSAIFDIEPLVVTGIVTKGDEPVPGANLEWAVNRDDPLLVNTDDEGRYRVTLWRKSNLYVVLIRTGANDSPPYWETIAVDSSMEKDFHMPDTRLTILVKDANTDAPIPGAMLAIGNSGDGAAGGLSSTSVPAITDENGRVESPSLRAGRLAIYARAEGYRDAEVVDRPVPAEGEPVEVVIRMEPESETISLTILMPDRRPAVGAGAFVLDPDQLANWWHGTAGPEGRIELPRRLSGRSVIVRHPDAASINDVVASADREVILPPSAPRLRVTVVNSAGDPVPWAKIGYVDAGKRLLVTELGFLTWSHGVANRAGVWEAKGLPARPARIFAWDGTNWSSAAAGGYDALATEIPYPWPANASITLIK